MSDMKSLLEHIVKSIVNSPNDVVIEEKSSVDFPGLVIFTIKVADTDKGVVIGRKGRTINALRDIMTISAIRNDARIKVLIEEDEKDMMRNRERAENRDNRQDRNDQPREQREETPAPGNSNDDMLTDDEI
jgi:uncharacterized protein